MNNYNYTPGELISLFIDGELGQSERETLFDALSGNPELQAEFERALHINQAVSQEVLKTLPPVTLTNAIFAEAGFSSASLPAHAILMSKLGFFKKLFVPVIAAVLASVLTGTISYVYFKNDHGVLDFKNQSEQKTAGVRENDPVLAKSKNLLNDTNQEENAITPNSAAISRQESLQVAVSKKNITVEDYSIAEKREYSSAEGRPGPLNITYFNTGHRQRKPPQSQLKIPTDGLVAYYPFNGNANDASGNNFNGEVNGAALTIDRFGNKNSAYTFDGFDDYIAVHNAANSKLEPTDEITISCFIYADSSHGKNPWSRIIRKVDAFNNGYSLSWDNESNSSLQMFLLANSIPSKNHASSDKINISNRALVGAWHHITVTYSENSSTMKMYINGMLASATFNCVYDFQHSSDILFIGGTEGKYGIGKLNLETFAGKIDDIRIYERSLNEEEILSLYYEGGFGM